MSFIIVVLFVLWYLGAKQNPQLVRKIKYSFKNLFAIIIFAAIAMGILSEMLPALGALLGMAYVGAIIWMVFKLVTNTKKQKEYEKRTDSERKSYDMDQKLTKTVVKRKGFVEAFNKKYRLNLNSYEIETIVDASYVSVLWEEEIYSMTKEYNTVYEWLKGKTAWLRVYLYVFNVQEVSSDFEQQRAIAFSAFDQIFSETNFAMYEKRMDAIDAINRHYFTNFDEVTFMMAYRFLQSEGREYEIGYGSILRNEGEAEERERKYARAGM